MLGTPFCLALAVFVLSPVYSAIAQTVYVDDDATAGGTGGVTDPFQTIQEGVASLLPGGGTVLIQPGTYIGPIVVDGDNVNLEGDVTPIFDGDGFLTAFDDEVVITINDPLSDPGFTNGLGEPEDLVEFRGSGNELRKCSCRYTRPVRRL